jgi:hypothetical protein
MHGGTNPGPGKNNKNALKHGIYSDVLDPDEKEQWHKIEVDTLEDEIKILKLRLKRAIKAGNDDMIDRLSGKIAKLARTHKELGNTSSDDDFKELMQTIGAAMVQSQAAPGTDKTNNREKEV